MTDMVPKHETLFHEAKRIADAKERERFLAQACGNDAVLRANVEELLSADAEQGIVPGSVETMDVPILPRGGSHRSASTFEELPTERPGTVIGRYKLTRQIGEGGFGIVYLAEQHEPVRRNVALKIIKLGMDTRDVIARFEAERQALAVMDHPHIAKVLDAGATEAGRPYFVMELVKGIPITDYCDEKEMPVRDRLRLFVQVCVAVQHAHQKGIIHRDLKPSNVLVTHVDDKPVPKVIDFGIAKATQQRLTERTMFTQLGQFMGTPAYMSPEQADASELDIDTRSDIYSLGVLLYELLTGRTPFDGKTLRAAAIDEIKRIIRENDPPRPSTRLSTLGDNLVIVAKRRGVEPKGLGAGLRGDLDWIVMRAMEKDRTRRYESATELARDIERHLNQEPVLAGPPSATYRMSKFVRRHWTGVAAAAVAFLALCSFAVTMAVQARRIAEERDRANYERQMSDRVVEFQMNMLQRIVPRKLGESIAADLHDRVEAGIAESGIAVDQRESSLTTFDVLLSSVNLTDAARRVLDVNILAPAVQTVEEQFSEQPLVEARLQHALAATYSALGLNEQSLERSQRALELRRKHLGPEHTDTLRTLNSQAITYWNLGRNKESGDILLAAIPLFERVFGPEDSATLRAKMQRAILDTDRGLNAKAQKQFEELAKTQERVLGPDHYDLALTLANLGVTYLNQDHYAKAVTVLERALDIHHRRFGPGAPEAIFTLKSLSKAYLGTSRQEEAAKLLQDVVKQLEKDRGARHPDTINANHSLAELYKDLGRLHEAEPIARRVLDLQRMTQGDSHPQTLKAMSTLGIILATLGRHDEAGPIFSEAYEKSKVAFGANDKNTLKDLNNLAVHYWYMGQLQESLDLFTEYLAGIERTFGKDHAENTAAMANLALLYGKVGRHDEGRAMADRAIAIRTKTHGMDDVETLALRSLIATMTYEADQVEESIPLLTEVLTARRRVMGVDHHLTLESVYNLAIAKDKLGLTEEAAELLEDSLERRRRVVGANHSETLDNAGELARIWHAAGRTAEARELFLEVIAARRAAAEAEHASAWQLDACARLLLTCAVEDLRDPSESLKFALRANQATNFKAAAYLNTLARAQFDTGDRLEAVVTQRRAVDQVPEGSLDRAKYEEQLAEYEGAATP